jgi:endonuclease/exonuclease/phosphatase (EEP) superfamily protein YafD
MPVLIGWIGGALVVGVLTAAVLAGALSAFLPPTWFWWTGPFASVLPLTAGVTVLAVGGALVWAGRTHRYGLLVSGIALLLLIGARVAPHIPLGASRSAAPPAEDALRVMSLNTPGEHADRYASARQLVQFTEAQRPHLIALQEADVRADSTGQRVGTTPQVIGLISQLRYRPPPLPSPPEYLEQPLLGRVSLDSLTMHRLPFPRGMFRPTAVTEVQFVWQGTWATLINVHLHTVAMVKPWEAPGFRWYQPAHWVRYLDVYRDGALRRAAEARRIRDLIDRVDGPLIVTGDFNSTPYNWAYRHIAQGLQDTFAAAGRGWGATYPATTPLVRIDYILASSHWEVLGAWVPPAATLSDHRPVLADLRLGPVDP